MLNAADDRTCPVCGASEHRRRWLVPGKRDMTGQALELAQCSACEHIYQPRRVSTEELARWYAYMGRNAANFADTPLLHLRLQRQLLPLAPYRRHGRLLDVGCGGGGLLLAAERLGWTAFGTEISATCAEALRPRLGERLHEGDLASAPFEAASFDVITLSEVIEHLPDPISLLLRCHALLRPGGALWITTPNRQGLAGRLLGDRWRAVGDEHLSYFTASTLRLLLERAGFDMSALWTSGLDPSALRDLLPAKAPHTEAAAPASTVTVTPLVSPAMHVPFRARMTSTIMDLINVATRASRMGDGLRAIATRPPST